MYPLSTILNLNFLILGLRVIDKRELVESLILIVDYLKFTGIVLSRQ